MDLIETIARRVRRQPKPGAAPEDPMPPAATLEELADLHGKLLVERAAARALILDAPDKRDELLDEPGTDAAVRKLDRDVATAHLTLERLDRAEPELIRQIQAHHTDTAGKAWFELRGRVVAHLMEVADLRRALNHAEAGVLALKNEANRGGYDTEMQPVPWPNDIKLMVTPEQWAQLAGCIAGRPHMPRVTVKLWSVRFIEWTLFTPSGNMREATGYMAGQEAGFPAEVAWGLVNSGKAEWPAADNPLLIPPRPPKPPRRKRTPPTASQLDNIAGTRT